MQSNWQATVMKFKKGVWGKTFSYKKLKTRAIMRCAQIVSPNEVLVVNTVPLPKPQDRQVVIKVVAAGICHTGTPAKLNAKSAS